MLNRTRFVSRSAALLVGPALLSILGCSDDGLEKRYPVSGTVEYNGKPVAKGEISFVPKDAAGHGASGPIKDGSYSSLTTLNPGDGVMPGDYTVTVTAKEMDSGQLAADTENLASKHGMGKMTMIPPELLAKAHKAAKSSIPAKYESSTTSTLKATVKAESNTLNYKLED